MNKLIVFIVWIAIFHALPSHAQTATPVTPGFMTTTGCGSASPCFRPSGSVPSTTTNSSSTITLGGTFQTISAINDARKSLDFINICNIAGNCNATTDICYLNFGVLGSATLTNSIPVTAGAEYIRTTGTVPSTAINVTCTATSDKFYFQTQ